MFKKSLNGIFLSWPWAYIKHWYLTIFYCLENWNKCVCVVWLARWSLVSCHSVWKWLSMLVIAKQQLWRTFTCATFVTGILVMTFFLVLAWRLHVWPLVCVTREKHQFDDHLGFAEAFASSLETWWAARKQPACLCVLRKASSLESIRSCYWFLLSSF